MKSYLNKICIILVFFASFQQSFSQTLKRLNGNSKPQEIAGIKKSEAKIITIDVAKPDEVKNLGFDQKVLDDFENEVSKSIQQKEIAGAVTLIARKGKIVHFEAKGESQMETHIPMKKDAIFRIASMTKPIATLALLLLIEDRKCKPNDPVSKYLPEFASQQILLSKDSVDGIWIYKTREVTKPMLIRHV
jgi:CubicO group peptidase (beta-lactamase class C family)